MYKVLIIDDEPWSREVVKSLGNWVALKLELAGEGQDGSQGLELIGSLKPDIVITDMRMPGVEGVELLKTISEQFPGTKIIVMSGYDDFAYLKQAILSRAIEYLLKPIDPDELNTALSKCIEDLDRTRENAGVILGVSPLFGDSKSLDRYTSIRQVIYGHMLELNKAAVNKAFGDLGRFLEKLPAEAVNKSALARIGQDLIVMLKEFTVNNDFGFDKLWNDKNSEWVLNNGWRSKDELIADISWLFNEAVETVESRVKNKNRLDLSEVQAYMDKHYQESITLETIAQRFFVSKEHLSRAFKAFSSENISDYILRKRMEKAKELILEQKIAIKHVAQMLGYDDIAYFYRVFKKQFGVPPGELRNEE